MGKDDVTNIVESYQEVGGDLTIEDLASKLSPDTLLKIIDSLEEKNIESRSKSERLKAEAENIKESLRGGRRIF